MAFGKTVASPVHTVYQRHPAAKLPSEPEELAYRSRGGGGGDETNQTGQVKRFVGCERKISSLLANVGN